MSAPEKGNPNDKPPERDNWRAGILRGSDLYQKRGEVRRLGKEPKAPPSPDSTARSAATEGARAVTGKEQSLAKLDQIVANWPSVEELERLRLSDSGAFRAGEQCRLTGNAVNFRRSDGNVDRRLSRGVVLTVSDPVVRFPHPTVGEVFIQVIDNRGSTGFIAERYLKPIEARKEVVAKRKGKLETADEAMFREVVLHHLDDVFGKDPAEKKLKAQKDRLYAKWDAGYSALVRRGVTGDAFDEGVKKLYRDLFGSSRDIFEEKVELEIALAIGAGKAGTEVVTTNPNPEDAFNEALGKLGYEIGLYYKRGRMSPEEIRTAFNLNMPSQWGGLGSRIVFSYIDGNIYFYPPKGETKEKRVPVVARPALKLRIIDEPPPGVSQERWAEMLERGRNPEKELYRIEEQEIALSRPQNPELRRLADQRNKEFLARRRQAEEERRMGEAGV